MSSALTNQPTFQVPLQLKRSKFSASSRWRPTCIIAAKKVGDGNESTTSEHLRGFSNSQARRSWKQPPKSWISNSEPVGLWGQFPTARTVQQMMETMERMMQEPFANSGISLPSLSKSAEDKNEVSSYRGWRTPWEIKEGDGEYKMRFDMPGMTKDDVKVCVEKKILVVKAEKLEKNTASSIGTVNAKEGQQEDWFRKSYGRYDSRIVMPDNIDATRITAEVKDGVLYITIPKALPPSKMVDIDVK